MSMDVGAYNSAGVRVMSEPLPFTCRVSRQCLRDSAGAVGTSSSPSLVTRVKSSITMNYITKEITTKKFLLTIIHY